MALGAWRWVFALGMYISYFLCRFHLCRAANANPFFGGIWALNLSQLINTSPCHTNKYIACRSIDLIFTNMDHTVSSGTLDIAVGDHLPVFLIKK